MLKRIRKDKESVLGKAAHGGGKATKEVNTGVTSPKQQPAMAIKIARLRLRDHLYLKGVGSAGPLQRSSPNSWDGWNIQLRIGEIFLLGSCSVSPLPHPLPHPFPIPSPGAGGSWQWPARPQPPVPTFPLPCVQAWCTPGGLFGGVSCGVVRLQGCGVALWRG